MSSNSAQEQRYLVLNIIKGLRFNSFNDDILQISTVFQNEHLNARYIAPLRDVNIDLYYMWCTTARHMNLLQKWRSNIEITVSAIDDFRTSTVGSVRIGIQQAQVLGPGVKLSTQRFPVFKLKSKIRMVLQPELFLTLSIRSEPPFNIDSPLYSANLTESSRPVSTVARTDVGCTDSATTKTNEVQNSLNLLSQPWSYQKEKILRSLYRPPTTKQCYTWFRPSYKRLVTDKLRSVQIGTPLQTSKRTLKQYQEMYKDLWEPQKSDVQSTCSSIETLLEVPRRYDRAPTLLNDLRIPSRILLITQNIDTSKWASLGIYGSSSTFKMITPPVKSLLPTPPLPPLPNNMRIPQNNCRSKMKSPPPTNEPEVYVHKAHDTFFVPLSVYLKIFKQSDSITSVRKLPRTEEEEEKEIEIQDYRDETPAAVQIIPPKTHVKVKKCVRFKEDTDIIPC